MRKEIYCTREEAFERASDLMGWYDGESIEEGLCDEPWDFEYDWDEKSRSGEYGCYYVENYRGEEIFCILWEE